MDKVIKLKCKDILGKKFNGRANILIVTRTVPNIRSENDIRYQSNISQKTKIR